jgi:GT2 family glycosyltransferase
MAQSPLPSAHLPGPAVMGFLAGASIFRRQAFLDAGGFNPRLFIGGEESLLTLDLASRGWQLVYAPQLVVHHHPSTLRDSLRRRQLLARNAIWIAWLRRPFASACRETASLLAAAHGQGHLLSTLWAVARGMPWVCQNRRVIPRHVETLYRWRNRTGY